MSGSMSIVSDLLTSDEEMDWSDDSTTQDDLESLKTFQPQNVDPNGCLDGSKREDVIPLPEELRKQLRPLELDNKAAGRLKETVCLDGILVSTRNLGILNPVSTVRFPTINCDSIKATYGEKLKGLTHFHDRRVYAVEILQFGVWKVKLCYLGNYFLPPGYLDYSKFAQHVEKMKRAAVREIATKMFEHNVHGAVAHSSGILHGDFSLAAGDFHEFCEIFRQSIVNFYKKYCVIMRDLMDKHKMQLENLNAEYQRYPDRLEISKSFQATALKDKIRFGEQPFLTLERKEETFDDNVFFTLERFGGDTKIPDNILKFDFDHFVGREDIEESDVEKFVQLTNDIEEFLLPFGSRLKEISEEDAKHTKIVFHYTLDRQLEPTEGGQHSFLFWNAQKVIKEVPYNYKTYNVLALPGISNLITKAPVIHSLSFYGRLMHEIHRNVNKWFTTTRITEQLLAMAGPKLFPPKRKAVETVREKQILAGGPKKMIDNLIDRVVHARCGTEARLEKHQMVSLDQELYERTIYAAFILGLHRFLLFLKIEWPEVKKPEFLVSLEQQALTKWLQRTMAPAADVIKRAVDSVKEDPQRFFDDLNDVHYSEFLISYMITGEKRDAFSEAYVTDVGLDRLNGSSLMDDFKLENVSNLGTELRFLLPRNFVDVKLVTCIFSKLQGKTSLPIFQQLCKGTAFRKVNRQSITGRAIVEKNIISYVEMFLAIIPTTRPLNATIMDHQSEYRVLWQILNTIVKFISNSNSTNKKNKDAGLSSVEVHMISFDSFWEALLHGKMAMPGLWNTIVKTTLSTLEDDDRNHQLSAGPTELFRDRLVAIIKEQNCPLSYITEQQSDSYICTLVVPSSSSNDTALVENMFTSKDLDIFMSSMTYGISIHADKLLTDKDSSFQGENILATILGKIKKVRMDRLPDAECRSERADTENATAAEDNPQRETVKLGNSVAIEAAGMARPVASARRIRKRHQLCIEAMERHHRPRNFEVPFKAVEDEIKI